MLAAHAIAASFWHLRRDARVRRADLEQIWLAPQQPSARYASCRAEPALVPVGLATAHVVLARALAAHVLRAQSQIRTRVCNPIPYTLGPARALEECEERRRRVRLERRLPRGLHALLQRAHARGPEVDAVHARACRVAPAGCLRPGRRAAPRMRRRPPPRPPRQVPQAPQTGTGRETWLETMHADAKGDRATARSARHSCASARCSGPRAAHALLLSAHAPARPPAQSTRSGTSYLPQAQPPVQQAVTSLPCVYGCFSLLPLMHGTPHLSISSLPPSALTYHEQDPEHACPHHCSASAVQQQSFCRSCLRSGHLTQCLHALRARPFTQAGRAPEQPQQPERWRGRLVQPLRV